MKSFLSISLIVLVSVGCRSPYAINDPLPNYWQMKVNDKNYNDIERQIKKKLDEIEDELYKLPDDRLILDNKNYG